MRMPRKNMMVERSMRESRSLTRFAIVSPSSVLWWNISVVVHSRPSTNRIPINGGRWVRVLKMGTKIRPPTPIQKMMLRCLWVNWLTSAGGRFCDLSNFPFSEYCRIKAGTSIDTSDGMKISLITPWVVITPFIHSMMVVTSPIGEKAPPELAAMTTMAA